MHPANAAVVMRSFLHTLVWVPTPNYTIQSIGIVVHPLCGTQTHEGDSPPPTVPIPSVGIFVHTSKITLNPLQIPNAPDLVPSGTGYYQFLPNTNEHDTKNYCLSEVTHACCSLLENILSLDQ
mmetsp:Transcript_421/g.510  ORF Transcript_421/g.510 Transcript_421/m.510 type:complete len:123 (-) Transcript_421:95-463(-)